jgi:hypothetical protein
MSSSVQQVAKDSMSNKVTTIAVHNDVEDSLKDSAASSPKRLRAALMANASTLVIYAAGLMFAPIVYHALSDKEFSAVLTFGALLNCLGLAFLALQQQAWHGEVVSVGLSANAFDMYLAALVAKLSSTLWLSGYLPIDRTGDFLYQSADLCSLALVYRLRQRAPQLEGAPDARTVIICAIVISLWVHPSLNNYLFFDIAWMTGLLLEAAALMPQLILDARPKASSHGVLALICSKALAALFWFHGFEDVAPDAGVNYPGWGILAAYAIQLVLLIDLFMYSLSRTEGNLPSEPTSTHLLV